MDLKKRLAKIKESYKAAKERDPTSGFERVPDGMYRMKLVDAEVGESQSSGRLQVKFEWQVDGGEHDGRSCYDYQGIETEDNIFYFGRLLSRLGREMPEDPTNIPDLLTKMVEDGVVIQGQLRTTPNKAGGDDYQNLRVRKLLSGAAEDEGSDEETTTKEPESEPESEPEAEESASWTPAKDDRVSFKLGGKDAIGTILKFADANTAIVANDADKKNYKVAVAKLTQYEEPEAEPETEKTEEVVEDAEPEAEEAEVTVDVGTTVSFSSKGKVLTGTIKEFVNDDSAKVQVGKTIYTVALEECELPVVTGSAEKAETPKTGKKK